MDRKESKKALIYTRISSKDQEEKNYSIDTQLKLLRDFAARENFEVLKEFVDVETEKKSGRVAFGRMVSWQRSNPDVRTILLLKRPTTSITTLRIG